MKTHEQYRVDALNRSKNFLDSNVDAVVGLAHSAGMKQLDESLVALAAFSNQQASVNRFIKGRAQRERALTADLVDQHMRPIATFARARLRGVPDFAALVKHARKVSGAAIVREARGMATAAAPHVAALVAGGFPADAVTQLGAAADALEAALTDRANAKVGRVTATRGIAEEIKDGREALAMLHAVVSRQLTSNPTLLAGWNSARRVTSKPGVARGGSVSTPVTQVTPVVQVAPATHVSTVAPVASDAQVALPVSAAV